MYCCVYISFALKTETNVNLLTAYLGGGGGGGMVLANIWKQGVQIEVS